MITINKLSFSNVFCYGSNVEFIINDRVTQLVGANGSGKSSLPAILEEGLYNKNSKGIKKVDILNRYSDANSYEIAVDFNVNNINYILHKTVAKTAKVKLTENGKDVSGHTATQTYASLESILGMNFSTFTKLVNQSIISNLDFLTATDGERKKFLISLLGLDDYVEAEKLAKEALKQAKSDLAMVEGSVNARTDWIGKNSTKQELKDKKVVPEIDTGLQDTLQVKKSEAMNINLQNQERRRNKERMQHLTALENTDVQEVYFEDSEDFDRLSLLKEEVSKEKAIHAAEFNKLNKVSDRCPTCKQPIDIGDTKQIMEKAKDAWELAKDKLEGIDAMLAKYNKLKTDAKKWQQHSNALKVARKEYDESSPTALLDSSELAAEISSLEATISEQRLAISQIEKHNSSVDTHNALVLQKRQMLEEAKKSLAEDSARLENCKDVVNKLTILSEAFGSKGLIAYKIESSVKVFEELINQYLQLLSDGKFALTFVVDGTKLALKIYNDSREVDIKSLSSGEFNKVSSSSLLAIRKMMTSISKVDLNILFLDEVVSVLDAEGKDTLIEVLLREQNLNTVVVSHGYTHPLASVINVVKENDISRLEYNE